MLTYALPHVGGRHDGLTTAEGLEKVLKQALDRIGMLPLSSQTMSANVDVRGKF